jgi:hypothetical protein
MRFYLFPTLLYAMFQGHASFFLHKQTCDLLQNDCSNQTQQYNFGRFRLIIFAATTFFRTMLCAILCSIAIKDVPVAGFIRYYDYEC